MINPTDSCNCEFCQKLRRLSPRDTDSIIDAVAVYRLEIPIIPPSLRNKGELQIRCVFESGGSWRLPQSQWPNFAGVLLREITAGMEAAAAERTQLAALDAKWIASLAELERFNEFVLGRRAEVAEHCACTHDGRGSLINECQEHSELGEEVERLKGERRAIDVEHLEQQRDFSLKTFGPGQRTAGLVAHIRKELDEIEADPADILEWADVIILAFDGAWRAGWEPQQIIDAIKEKQRTNELRQWPDWRSFSEGEAIEHVKRPELPNV